MKIWQMAALFAALAGILFGIVALFKRSFDRDMAAHAARGAAYAASTCAPERYDGVMRLLNNGNGSWTITVPTEGKPGRTHDELVYGGGPEGSSVEYVTDAPVDGPMYVTVTHAGDKCGGAREMLFHIHAHAEIGGGAWQTPWSKTAPVKRGNVTVIE